MGNISVQTLINIRTACMEILDHFTISLFVHFYPYKLSESVRTLWMFPLMFMYARKVSKTPIDFLYFNVQHDCFKAVFAHFLTRDIFYRVINNCRRNKTKHLVLSFISITMQNVGGGSGGEGGDLIPTGCHRDCNRSRDWFRVQFTSLPDISESTHLSNTTYLDMEKCPLRDVFSTYDQLGGCLVFEQ